MEGLTTSEGGSLPTGKQAGSRRATVMEGRGDGGQKGRRRDRGRRQARRTLCCLLVGLPLSLGRSWEPSTSRTQSVSQAQ